MHTLTFLDLSNQIKYMIECLILEFNTREYNIKHRFLLQLKYFGADVNKKHIYSKQNNRKKWGHRMKKYRFVNVINPKSSLSSLIRIRRQKAGFVTPHLIIILHNNCRLTNGLSVMDENRDFLVDGVHLKKKRTLVA